MPAVRVKTSTGWQDIALVGPAGAKGDKGDQGDTGAAGTVYDSDQIGVVKGWSGKTIPTNWALADGTRYTQAAYPQGYDFAKQEADAGNPLWTYRASDFTFTVPNLTDKFILAPGANLLGSTGGEKDHILLPAETAMKAHNHGGVTGTGGSGTDAPDHTHGYVYNDIYATIDGGSTANVSATLGTGQTGGASARHTHSIPGLSIPSETAINGSAHNNMPPWVVVAMIVKIKGASINPAGALVGPPGPGVAVGGTPGQILAKLSGTNYDTAWTTPAQGGHTIQDEGAGLTTRAGLNFIGSGVVAADDAANDRTNITISGGGGGAGAPEVYVGPDPPTPRDQQVIWIDTDEAAPASLNVGMDVWHTVGNPGEPAFQNGWVNYGVAPYNLGVRFRKYPEGKVRIAGIVKSGTLNVAVFTLPPGYRPPTEIVATVWTGAATPAGAVTLRTNGDVICGTSNAYQFLDGIEFDTETVNQAASVAAQPLDSVHVVGASGEPAFAGTWTSYDAGATFHVPRFRKDPFGMVRLSGQAKGGAGITTGSLIFTLPVGYRPPKVLRFGGVESTTAGPTATWQQVNVYPDGTVVAYADSNGIVSLDGIEFDTESLTTYSTGAIIPSAQSMSVSMDSWHTVGVAGEPAFANGWVNYGGAESTAGFRKYPDGRVRLRGIIKNGTSPVMFTMPVGYWPTSYRRFSVPAHNGSIYGTAEVDVYPDGSVRAITTPFNTNTGTGYVDISGVEFDTESTLVTASIAVQPIDTWHTVGAAGEPAFSAGVSNGSDQVASFRKYPDGRVRLRGWVNCPAAAGSGLFTLPAGYRPPRDFTRHPVVDLAGSIGYVYIRADGVVIKQSAQTQICIDGVEFDTEGVSNYATAVVQGATPALNPVVTALPVSPVDGQEIYYRFVPTATPSTTIPIIWHMRWDAVAACWLPVGQQEPIIAGYVPGASVSMGVNLWGTYDANDPRVTAPRAGVYEIEAGIGEAYGPVNTVISGIGINGSPNTTTTGEGSGTQYNAQSGGSQQLKVAEYTLAINDVARQYYYAFAGAGPQNVVMRNRYIQIRPKKITG